MINTVNHLVETLKSRPVPELPRRVWMGMDRKYYVTMDGGEVSKSALDDAIRQGLIEPAFTDHWQLRAEALHED